MKNLGLYIAAVSWGWGVLYLLGSFVAASFDVTVWDVMGRFLIALVGAGIAGITAFVFAFE